jgi:hypothetical protein
MLTALLHNNGSHSIVACIFIVAGMCLPSHCLTMNVYSHFTIPAFGRHVKYESEAMPNSEMLMYETVKGQFLEREIKCFVRLRRSPHSPVMKRLLCYVTVLMAEVCALSHQNVSNQTFPTNFLIGAATSAFQIEGAWNESGIFPFHLIRLLNFFYLINRLVP